MYRVGWFCLLLSWTLSSSTSSCGGRTRRRKRREGKTLKLEMVWTKKVPILHVSVSSPVSCFLLVSWFSSGSCYNQREISPNYFLWSFMKQWNTVSFMNIRWNLVITELQKMHLFYFIASCNPYHWKTQIGGACFSWRGPGYWPRFRKRQVILGRVFARKECHNSWKRENQFLWFFE